MWLRTVTQDDVPAICQLLIETWHATYDDLLGVQQVDEITSRWHSPAMLQQYLSDPLSEYIIADNGKALCGVAYARQGGTQAEAGYVILHQLYVRPDAQRQGIGKALLTEMEACFPAAKYMRLTILEKNRKAVQFYENQGYKSVDEPLPTPENADVYEIVMEKALAN